MASTYSSDQRRALAAAVRRGERPPCPACGGALAYRPIRPEPDAAYVRRRLWLICTRCKRSAVLDVRGAAPP